MNLADLKNRSIKILSYVDNLGFKDLIADIEKIKAIDESGFADIYAKSEVIRLILSALKNQHYFDQMADPRKKRLLNTLFNDGLMPLEIKTNLLNSADNSNIELSKTSFYELTQSAESRINTFLENAKRLHSIYQNRAQASLLKQVIPTHVLFDKMGVDVEMEDEVVVNLSKKKLAVGTTGLGSCLAIILMAKNKKNEVVVSIGHFSSSDSAMIKNMQSDFISMYELSNSIHTYLVGGCIATLDDNLELIMQEDLGITDFRLCLSDGENMDDVSSVVISSQYPNAIYYASHEAVDAKKELREKAVGSLVDGESKKQDLLPRKSKKHHLASDSSLFNKKTKYQEEEKKQEQLSQQAQSTDALLNKSTSSLR